MAESLAETATGTLSAVRGRSRIRGADLLGNIRDAGPSALIIVSVVTFLVGAILAFVGAAQLRKFAADAYMANLVGIALVRELAAKPGSRRSDSRSTPNSRPFCTWGSRACRKSRPGSSTSRQ